MTDALGPTLFARLTAEFLTGLERDIMQDDDPQLRAWRADPILWMTDVLGIPRRTIVWSEFGGAYATHKWDGTPDPLAAICRALAEGKSVGVESATGTGKTFLGAALVLWFTDCWRNSVVVTAAPKEDQLKLHIWKELGAMFPRFRRRRPAAELTSLSLKMAPPGEKWKALGFPVGVVAEEVVATKAAGFHEKDMLIITEETPGIKGAVMAAFEQTSVAPHNLRLAFGNPDHREDSLHRFCVSPGITHVRISALDHPNVVCDDPMLIPGAVSLPSIRQRTEKYGEGSPMYLSRIRGVSPAQASDALIHRTWLDAAVDRGRELCRALGIRSLAELLVRPDLKLPPPFDAFDGALALGVDVANSENGDLAAVARGRGAILCEVPADRCPDANVLGATLAITDIAPRGIDADYVGVDYVGVGVGCANELVRLGYDVQKLIGGALAEPGVLENEDEQFLNLRAQMHWLFRLDAQYGRLIIDDDEELILDLTTPTWRPASDKKIQVEAKEALRKRLPGKRSPNKGDAAVYWNWVRQVRQTYTMANDAGNVSF